MEMNDFAVCSFSKENHTISTDTSIKLFCQYHIVKESVSDIVPQTSF